MFSYEVLPPLKGTGTASLFRTIDTLNEFRPDYINITTHRSEWVYTQQDDGSFLRSQVCRRPSTIAVASAIMQKYNIRVVPHLVCSGFSRQEIEYMLLDLQFLGITDLLILRGDKAKDESMFHAVKGGHSHATELIEQVNMFNAGRFIDGSELKAIERPFSFGVACYPEKHDEAPNLDFDITVLKMKQDLGAKYAVTQLFYDNRKYFDFVERARKAGVTIPIRAGIKPLTKRSQLTVVPKTFHVDIPAELANEAMRLDSDEKIARLGEEWAVAQCRELMANECPQLHFYTVSAVDSIKNIARELF